MSDLPNGSRPRPGNVEAQPSIDRTPAWRRVWRLLGYARPYRVQLGLALAALLLTVLGGLAVPWLFGDLLGEAFDSRIRDASNLDRTTLVLVGVIALQSVFVFVRHYLMSWVGERVVADLRVEVHRHLLAMTQRYFHDNRTGELLSRQSDDATRLQTVVGQDLSMALRNILALVLGVAVLFFISAKLTGVMLLVVPPLVVTTVWFGRIIRKISRQAQDQLARASGTLQEGLGAIGTVQSFTREDHESRAYAGAVERAFEMFTKLIGSRSAFRAVASFLSFAAVVGIFWLGGRMAIDGDIDAKDLGKFVLYTLSVAGAVGGLAGVVGSYNTAIGASTRIFEILDTEPEIQDHPDARDLVDPKGRLTFSNLEFSYGDRDNTVIQGLDLTIEPAEVCALVGSSGSGKSTLARLLLRFWDPQAGSIAFDGVDIRELRLGSLRGAMAEVSQDPVLFSGSVRENIRYGRLEASDAEVETAAVAANADGFIREFSDGYDTVVGERGVKLSGGQRQRIAIARAILRDPTVLILDEATSALDSESEHMVQSALERLQKGRTTLVIAHRLSTIRDADRIVVLDHGRIVEQGRHAELLAKQGAYARLVARQASSASAPT
jgi:ABC transporter fused permease/ATP-binding protein